MNSDQINGKLQDIGGKIQEEAGKIVGSSEQQVKGLQNQVEGKTQEKLGDLKEKSTTPPNKLAPRKIGRTLRPIFLLGNESYFGSVPPRCFLKNASIRPYT